SLNTNSSLTDISDKRYWAVDVAAGSLTGTKIILPFAGDEGLDAALGERRVVAFADNKDDDFVSIGRGPGSTNALIESEQSPAMGVVTLGILSEDQSIVVFNAISPNPGDEINNYIHIDNLVEGDVVSIYNRWGDLVFEMKEYDNDDTARRFNGRSNVSGAKDLPAGSYFYVIRRKAGKEVSGFLSLRK
ncbi:MAG TPA: gliding motility-associated C-terminal domain-containing protein, partial [Cyclobacteriaceae bacterium]|nr:gliding motility-associated C-terminal domain-containing protein [Cyclobacteriaceae bacterium]